MIKRLAIINNKNRRAENNIYAKHAVKKIKNKLGADIAFTKYRGHAEEITRSSAGYDTLIATGGDGTISEVVNNMNLETQTLAVIPFGRGNSFARGLGIGSTVKALEVIRRGRSAKIDIIDCRFETSNGKFKKYSVATSGLGLASSIAVFANRYLKIAGPFCYALSACFKMFKQEVIPADITIGDLSSEEIRFTNFLVNNGMYSANARVFPRADLGDSMLNFLFTKTNALRQYLWNISVITKTYFYRQDQKTANKLRIALHKPSAFMLDGEIFPSVKEIKYSVLPQMLNVII